MSLSFLPTSFIFKLRAFGKMKNININKQIIIIIIVINEITLKALKKDEIQIFRARLWCFKNASGFWFIVQNKDYLFKPH